MINRFAIMLAAALGACQPQTNPSSSQTQTTTAVAPFAASLDLAVQQYKRMDQTLAPDQFPRSTNPDGSLRTNKSDWWTSGFYPGSLWYLYEYSQDPEMKQLALTRTKAVEQEQHNVHDHDIGFKMYCSYGNALRLTGDQSIVPILLTSARSLVKRFDPEVGLIRSWGSHTDKVKPYLVIIDNMMNLELLFWATKQSGDSTFYKVAVAHADNTIKNHFRPDGSSYHVVEYNPTNGQVLKKRTAQGYADESAWARGQAWGLYGYTMSYRETGHKRYLDQAQKIANFMFRHQNLPADKIPYWDYNAPNIPNALRDVSAGAIAASALLELSTLAENGQNSFYRETAETMVRNLSQEPYRAELGENNNFLLKHSVGHIPENSEVDVPLSYADYYYLESMMRIRDMAKKGKN